MLRDGVERTVAMPGCASDTKVYLTPAVQGPLCT